MIGYIYLHPLRIKILALLLYYGPLDWTTTTRLIASMISAVKGAQSPLNGLKSLAKLFNFVVCNPCQSSPSLTILLPVITLMESPEISALFVAG